MFKKIFGFGEIQMPTAKVLIVCSWVASLTALAAGLRYLLSDFFKGLIWIVSGLVILALFRLLANIGDLYLKGNRLISEMAQELRKINCDSADINSSLLDITDFISEVQRKLDLK